jgi:hypothetical protein
MAVRDELHALVDALPESELNEARRYLRSVAPAPEHPVVRFLREAPEDDEPTTPEEDRAAEEAWQEYLQEGGMRSDDAKRMLLP